MSVTAENGRDETLGVGLFGGGSVGDHAPTEASAHQRRRSWCAARDGHADAVGCEAPAETRREGLGKRVRRREHGGVLRRVATAADDEATPTAPPRRHGVAETPRELRRRLGDSLGECRVQPLGLALGAAQLLKQAVRLLRVRVRARVRVLQEAVRQLRAKG